MSELHRQGFLEIEIERSRIAEFQQGSEEWALARVGKVTASRCGHVVATSKRGEAAVRSAYRSELICEILTGVPYPQFVSKEMQWGRDQEGFARAAYEMHGDIMVDTCGFALHPDHERFRGRFGASPDGLVGDDGLLQIKCPTTSTHLGWLLAGAIPLEHMPQMLAEMACTGRSWCDFVSYDPRLPEHLQLFVRRFARNNELIAQLESEVVHFNCEIDSQIAKLPGKPQSVLLAIDQIHDDEVEF